MHILLLEPNTLIAKTYTHALSQAGHTVHHALSAQAAIDAADAAGPDLVIMELQLPAHGGVEFLHEFRSYSEWQHTPVIVNTVLAPTKIAGMRDILRQELGVATVLYKPQATIADLLKAVRAVSP